ncbi:MAG: hypothetical protein PWQ94_2272 [Thermoanaerobacterium sp.]|nr:hypothetical protein [Thermoanaerobacterium sp.]
MPDYTSILNNIQSEIGNIASNIFLTVNSVNQSIHELNKSLITTNWLLLLLVIVLSINTFINWKRYKSDK